MDPALRREHADTLVRGYYDTLMNQLKENGKEETFTYEQCFDEYVNGGFGRWVWFIPFLGGGKMGQFFHDQLAAFAKDHIPDPSLAPMPRV